MIEIGLFELIGTLAALLGINMAGTISFMNWRITKLEQCIDNQKGRLDRHIDRGD